MSAGAKTFTLNCPSPITRSEHVTLAHGGGGRLMHQLLDSIIYPAFRNDLLDTHHDGAVLSVGNTRLAFTTDSFVVNPLVFPGGDIGSLAVNGTVNDLSMCGARPVWLSTGLILEEGLGMDLLERIVNSMREAADAAGMQIVTGDTKVVNHGKGDGIFINTAGVGVIEHRFTIAPGSVRPGDAVLLSGDIGRHGIAIMALREGLELETPVESDCAPLAAPVQALLRSGVEIHCLRDLTRGGMATTLIEIAESSRLHVGIEEDKIAVQESVRGACEILGFDPLYLANEGRFIAFVPARDAERALAALQPVPVSRGAAIVGFVDEGTPRSAVTLKTTIGTQRVLDMLSGEQLPRIC